MVSVVASPPAFSISAVMPSAPGAFSNFVSSIADFTSAADGESMLTRFVSFRDVCYACKMCASLLIEDGLKVRFPQFYLFFYTRNQHPHLHANIGFVSKVLERYVANAVREHLYY